MSDLDAAQAGRVRWILWGALLGTQLVYVALAASGLARIRQEPLDLPVLPIAFGGVALTTAVLSHIFWRRASGAGRALHERGPEPVAAQTGYLVAWVCDESVAIYGLVLALLAFGPGTWLAFSGAGLALMLLHRPAS